MKTLIVYNAHGTNKEYICTYYIDKIKYPDGYKFVVSRDEKRLISCYSLQNAMDYVLKKFIDNNFKFDL